MGSIFFGGLVLMRIGCSILDIILTELGNFVRKFVDFLKNEAVGIL